MNKVLLGDILAESKIETLNPDPNNRITVRLNVKGVEKRPVKNDTEGATKYYIRSFNQFIYGKQNLFKGAFGIIPKELDGFETSSDLPCFDIDINRCKPEWILYFFKKGDFYKTLEKLARGAGSKRISPKDFFKIEIPLPSLNQQEIILNKIFSITKSCLNLEDEISRQTILLQKLRQSILQEAIEGKLTAQWRRENPNVEPASKLLQKIRAEKEQLIKEKKIKKEKPLPKINDDEIPFDVPDSWEWVRLGDICSKIGSGSTPRGSNYSENGVPFFRSQNIHNNGLVYDDIKYISKQVHDDMSGTSVYKNDVLLNITGGSMGRCALVPNDFIEGNVSQHVCIIRPIIFNCSLMHKIVLSQFFQKNIFSSTTGAGREGLPKNNLEQLPIPLIPMEEQQVILEKIHSLLNICDELEQQINESKANAEMLMQAVLKEAFEQ